jgi:hypothetical protein
LLVEQLERTPAAITPSSAKVCRKERRDIVEKQWIEAHIFLEFSDRGRTVRFIWLPIPEELRERTRDNPPEPQHEYKQKWQRTPVII